MTNSPLLLGEGLGVRIIMNKIKFITAILILAIVTSCGWFKNKVEEKVNEEVNKKIDESLKKVDSSFSKEKLDSLMKQVDSIKIKTDSLINKKTDRKSK